MEDKKLIHDRARMQAMLASTLRALDEAERRLGRQRHMVKWLDRRGYPSELARELLLQMGEITITLHCQRAWLEQGLRRTEYVDLDSQPHPLRAEPSLPEVVRQIRADLRVLAPADARSTGDVANDALINEAVRRVDRSTR